MSAYDPNVITRRLVHLNGVTVKLENSRPLTAEDLAASNVLSDATLHRVQVGIETIVDIGGHILSELYNKHPETYKDIIKEMGTTGIIPETFAEENMDMVDFRNIVVHHYVDIDPEKALANITKAPDVFQQFAEHIAKFLDKKDK